MKRILFALMILAAIASTSLAQFTITNLANAQIHNPPAPGNRIVGSNTYTRLTGTFPATSSGACSFPYPTQCNGIRVFLPGIPALASLVSVSTTQIDLIMPTIPSDTDYVIAVQEQLFGTWVASVSRTVFLEDRSLMPFVSFFSIDGILPALPYLIGTLYDSSGTIAIKSLADGTPNPRTYNGAPTIAQVYYTGGVSAENCRFEFLGDFTLDANLDAVYAPGVHIKNLVRSSGNWPIGSERIEAGFFSGGVYQQALTLPGYIAWAP